MATAMAPKRRTDLQSAGRGSIPRSPIDRGKLFRLVTAIILGVALAGAAAAESAKMFFVRRNPVLAAQLLGSSDAKVLLWTVGTLSDPKKLGDSVILSYAGKALRANPMNPQALRALAYYREAKKQPEASALLAELSAEVSRRDPLTQLLLAQKAMQDLQTKAAIDHIDLALTTVGHGREQIFPLLSKIFSYRPLRDELPGLLDRPKTWVPQYLDYVMRQDEGGPRMMAEVLLKARPASAAPVYKKLGKVLLSLLAAAREVDLLKRTYTRVRGDRPDVSQQPQMTQSTVDPTVGWLAWTAVGDGSTGADFRARGAKVEASVYASPGTRDAIVLRRVMMLEPGSYRHFEERDPSSGVRGASAHYQMRCLGSASRAVIWREPSRSLDYDASGSDGFSVPGDCPAQMLELLVTSPLGSGGSEFVIHHFDLRRSG